MSSRDEFFHVYVFSECAESDEIISYLIEKKCSFLITIMDFAPKELEKIKKLFKFNEIPIVLHYNNNENQKNKTLDNFILGKLPELKKYIETQFNLKKYGSITTIPKTKESSSQEEVLENDWVKEKAEDVDERLEDLFDQDGYTLEGKEFDD